MNAPNFGHSSPLHVLHHYWQSVRLDQSLSHRVARVPDFHPETKITHTSLSCVSAAQVIIVITQSQRRITTSYVLTGFAAITWAVFFALNRQLGRRFGKVGLAIRFRLAEITIRWIKRTSQNIASGYATLWLSDHCDRSRCTDTGQW